MNVKRIQSAACGLRGKDARQWTMLGQRLGAGALAATVTVTAGAQAAEAPSAATAASEHSFYIPVQPLGAALKAFAQQSGLDIDADPALIGNWQSPGVAGSLDFDEALRRLLAGTGLVATRSGTTVTIARGESEPVVLPTYLVRQAREESAYGPVVGFVAKRSATGTKSDTPLIETPASISVVTRDQMEAMGARTMTEALQYTAGVSASPYGNDTRGDFVTTRGFGFGGGDYRDGLANQIYDYIYSRTEAYGLERVEVLKGPASVLYGGNLPGGVINRVTKHPLASPYHEVQAQYGSFDRKQVAADFSGPLDDERKYLYRLTGLYRDADTQYEYGDTGHRVADDRTYLAPAFTWRPSENTHLTILADYLKDKTAAPFTYSPKSTEPPFTIGKTHTMVGDYTFDDYEQKQYSVGYQFEHDFTEKVLVRQNLRYNHNEVNYRLSSAPISAYGNIRTAAVLNQRVHGVTLDNQFQFGFNTGAIEHTIVTGLDYRDSNWDSLILAGYGPSLDPDDPVYGQTYTMPTAVNQNLYEDRDQTGVYLQDQMHFLERVYATVGGRQDWARSTLYNRVTTNESLQRIKTDDDAFTTRAGVLYLFDNGVAPYLNYSESFVPIAGANSNYSLDADEKPFKPEKGQQWETGVKYQPDSFNALFTGSLFDLKRQNVRGPSEFGGSSNAQTGEYEVKGAELEAKANLTRGIDLVASYTYLDAEITKSNNASTYGSGDSAITVAEQGKRPNQIPKHMASGWINYTFREGPAAGLGFGVGVRYVGKTYADNGNVYENEGYLLTDLSLRYDIETWRFALTANNALDKEYYVCWSPWCTEGAARNVSATITRRW